jgi:hypothetical protein
MIMSIEIKRDFAPADRYLYDFRLLTYAKGWAQVDTKQDASYYGTWTNPDERKIFCYCEGDLTLTTCSTDEEYKQAVTELVNWNKNSGYWIGIDAGLAPEFKDKFVKLGMREFLHASQQGE